MSYISRIISFRFTGPAGPVTFPVFGTEIVFDNDEVTQVVEVPGIRSNVIETENQVGTSTVDRVAQRWRVTARTFTPDTYRKLFHLFDQIGQGNKVSATLETSFDYAATNQTLRLQPITFPLCVIDFDGTAWRRMKAGMGMVKREEITFEVVRSAEFAYPSTGGGGGSGGLGGSLGGN